jgi:hypothetical protein
MAGYDVPIETNRPHCPVNNNLLLPACFHSLKENTVNVATMPIPMAMQVEASEFVCPDNVKLLDPELEAVQNEKKGMKRTSMFFEGLSKHFQLVTK